MKRVGFIDCSPAEKKFYQRTLVDYELFFYKSARDPYTTFDKKLDALVIFVSYNITKDIINFLPKLKLIACRSTGYDNIDIKYAKDKGIKVANTPGYGKQAVAEYVFALLLNLSRKINVTLEGLSDDEATDRQLERGFNLFGKTIGIIGLGAIGQGVASIAKGFGMDILAFEPYPDLDFVQRNGVKLAEDVDDLIKKSDVVTLHIPATTDNIHIIDSRRLELMKNSAILVNTARGELVDTVALVTALKDNRIGGAALDVVEEEYLLDPSEFIKFASENIDKNRALSLRHATAILALERMDNVIITNHNAYNTAEAVRLIANMTVQNIKGALEGGKIYEVQP